jgi:hypothetical protein
MFGLHQISGRDRRSPLDVLDVDALVFVVLRVALLKLVQKTLEVFGVRLTELFGHFSLVLYVKINLIV